MYFIVHTLVVITLIVFYLVVVRSVDRWFFHQLLIIQLVVDRSVSHWSFCQPLVFLSVVAPYVACSVAPSTVWLLSLTRFKVSLHFLWSRTKHLKWRKNINCSVIDVISSAIIISNYVSSYPIISVFAIQVPIILSDCFHSLQYLDHPCYILVSLHLSDYNSAVQPTKPSAPYRKC